MTTVTIDGHEFWILTPDPGESPEPSLSDESPGVT